MTRDFSPFDGMSEMQGDKSIENLEISLQHL
jgi:hypothetical protein